MLVPYLGAIGAISAALAVMAGAFGAHMLKDMLDARLLEVWNTAVLYHLFHSFALVLSTMTTSNEGPGSKNIAGHFFLLGIILFSGSLYLLATTGAKWLGPITPLGGLLFMAGWISMARQLRTKESRAGTSHKD